MGGMSYLRFLGFTKKKTLVLKRYIWRVLMDLHLIRWGVTEMRYYKDKNGDVFAYESKHDREKWGSPTLTEMTGEEVDAHLNPPEKTYVPNLVTRAQGKASLIDANLWEVVVEYVDSIENQKERLLADVALNDTTHWQRDSPFLIGCALSIGLSDEELDQLFIIAEKIKL